MSFFFNDFYPQRHRADWVQMSFAVTNFDAVRRPLKVKVRLFEAAGWNRHPKEIINVDYTLRRRISNVRFDNLPIGIPLYLHVSGDVVLADADEHGLISGVEQFLGQRAQVRLVARVPAQQQAAQRAPKQAPQQQPRTRPEWATGPRRFQKMHSLASRQSLVALGEYDGAITSLETRATAALETLARHLDGTASADVEKLKEVLYEIDDELEALRSSKLEAVHLDGLQSGAELATEKKKRLLARAAALSQRVRSALTHPVFPDSDSDDDAPSLEECEAEDEGEGGDLSVEEEEEEEEKPQNKQAGKSTTANGGSKAQEAPAQAENAAAASAASVPDLAPTATLEKPRTSFNAAAAAAPAEQDEAAQHTEEGGQQEEKPDVIAPPVFGKQYSTLSQQRLVKLGDIRDRVDVIASEYEGMLKLVETLDASTDEGVEALAKVKNECAQLYGNLEKLQFKEIDGVLVGDLTSGQADARTARKQLTRDVSDLSDRIKATVQELKDQLAK